MGAHGQLSHAGIAKEVIWGTPVGATDYLKIVSETLSKSIEELISTAQNARRDEPVSYEGGNTVAGDIVTEVHPAALSYFMRSWNGAPITTNNTGSYTHVFTPQSKIRLYDSIATAGDATTLTDGTQAWTIDEHIGRWVHIYAGPGAGDWRIITDNTETTITVAAWSATPTTVSRYEIRTGPENCVLPPYTFEIHRDLAGATPAFQYNGCVANTLAFSYGVGDKILKLTASLIGKGFTLLADTTPTMPDTEPFRWNQSVIALGSAVTGVATAGSTTTLTDTGAFTANAHIGDLCWIKTGTGKDQIVKIKSNTADILTFEDTLITAPAVDDTFEVFSASNKIETLSMTLENGLIPIPLLNNSKDIGRIDADAYRVGTLSPTMIVDDTTEWAYYDGWTTKEMLLYFRGAAITGDHDYWFAFYFPRVRFTAYPINVAGPGRIVVGATMKIKYDSTAKYPFKLFLSNNTLAP